MSKVSVCMVVYNHERFIVQAIEGVLMQQTTFEVELVIGNDASTDATNAVILELLANHPKAHQVRYFNHSENKGMMGNFGFILSQCQGDYVAFCDGDDYWIDPCKLQSQVDFLETHPNYVLHGGTARVLGGGNLDGSTIGRQEVLSLDLADFYTQNNLVTCTVMYRNQLRDFPGTFTNSYFGDWSLYVSLLKQTGGRAYHQDSCYAVYRLHASGTMTAIDSIRKTEVHMAQVSAVKAYVGYDGFSSRDIHNINTYLITKFRILFGQKKVAKAFGVLCTNFKFTGFQMPFRKYVRAMLQSKNPS